jgi:ubiquinone/menaquinone biosynthesis C-methylase UbiE
MLSRHADGLCRSPSQQIEPQRSVESQQSMDDLDLIIDLHRDGERQGPGSESDTRLAVTLSGLRHAKGLSIADIGCGTGASALVLARELDTVVTAVDNLQDFLLVLQQRAEREGLADRIKPLAASMEALPFDDEAFDAIWSEGAIYNMGFKNGITALRRFLKPGGILAVSELTWLTHERPTELEQHWNREYPEVDTASAKIKCLEECGYAPVGYFALSERSWLENYYRPMQRRFDDFLSRHGNSKPARSLVKAEENEIALYERHSEFISYGYYVVRKTAD